MKMTTKTKSYKVTKALDAIHSMGYRGDLMIPDKRGYDAIYSVTPRGWSYGGTLYRHAPLPTIDQVWRQLMLNWPKKEERHSGAA